MSAGAPAQDQGPRPPAAGGRGRAGAPAVMDPATPRSYYGRPVLKEPVWSPEVPLYFFTGGLAGASAPLAFAAELAGNEELARRAWAVALAGVALSPPLLIKDLGRPARFLHMFRVLKLSSPMSVGSWALGAAGALVTAAATRSLTGRIPRTGRAAGAGAAALGPLISTYTAVLLADTAVPAWHEPRRELPFVFAGSAAASAGGAATLLAPVAAAGPARRLAVAGALIEGVAVQLLERRHGEATEPYRVASVRRLARPAKALSALGAAVLVAGGRHAAGARAGGTLLCAGALLERFTVFRAGQVSARDPRYVVEAQRRRVEARAGERV